MIKRIEVAAPAGWEKSDDGRYWIKPDGTKQKVGTTLDERRERKAARKQAADERRGDKLMQKSLSYKEKLQLYKLNKAIEEEGDEDDSLARQMDYIKKQALSRGLAKQHLSKENFKKYRKLERRLAKGDSEAEEELNELLETIHDKKPKTLMQKLAGIFKRRKDEDELDFPVRGNGRTKGRAKNLKGGKRHTKPTNNRKRRR